MKNITAGAILAKQKRKNKKKPYSRSQVSAAAFQLGRAGGKKGGPARADALTDEQRTEIARFAANVRWGNETV